MKLARDIWWVAVLVLGTASLLAWTGMRQAARGQAERLAEFARAIGADPEAWQTVAVGEMHPALLYQTLQEGHTVMLIMGHLTAMMLVILLALLIGALYRARRAERRLGEAQGNSPK